MPDGVGAANTCCSKACAARSSVDSAPSRPTSIMPSGNPADIAHGTLMAGWPVTSYGAVLASRPGPRRWRRRRRRWPPALRTRSTTHRWTGWCRRGYAPDPVSLVWLPPEKQALTDRLAQDGAAGIEDPLHHRGIRVRDVALQDRRAVHHRHSGDTDVVLDGHGLARKHSVVRAADRRPVVPRTQRVAGVCWPLTALSRVAHRRNGFDQLVESVIGLQGGVDQGAERRHLVVGQAEVVRRRDPPYVVGGWSGNGHESSRTEDTDRDYRDLREAVIG